MITLRSTNERFDSDHRGPSRWINLKLTCLRCREGEERKKKKNLFECPQSAKLHTAPQLFQCCYIKKTFIFVSSRYNLWILHFKFSINACIHFTELDHRYVCKLGMVVNIGNICKELLDLLCKCFCSLELLTFIKPDLGIF
jgi:hypothetical protein